MHDESTLLYRNSCSIIVVMTRQDRFFFHEDSDKAGGQIGMDGVPATSIDKRRQGRFLHDSTPHLSYIKTTSLITKAGAIGKEILVGPPLLARRRSQNENSIVDQIR